MDCLYPGYAIAIVKYTLHAQASKSLAVHRHGRREVEALLPHQVPVVGHLHRAVVGLHLIADHPHQVSVGRREDHAAGYLSRLRTLRVSVILEVIYARLFPHSHLLGDSASPICPRASHSCLSRTSLPTLPSTTRTRPEQSTTAASSRLLNVFTLLNGLIAYPPLW